MQKKIIDQIKQNYSNHPQVQRIFQEKKNTKIKKLFEDE